MTLKFLTYLHKNYTSFTQNYEIIETSKYIIFAMLSKLINNINIFLNEKVNAIINCRCNWNFNKFL